MYSSFRRGFTANIVGDIWENTSITKQGLVFECGIQECWKVHDENKSLPVKAEVLWPEISYHIKYKGIISKVNVSYHRKSNQTLSS